MHTRVSIILLLLTTFAFAENMQKSATTITRYPILLRAEVPIYPPVALAAHIAGTVMIQVTLKSGVVTDMHVISSSSPFLSNSATANLKTWQFDSSATETFVVKYIYQIKGKQTPFAENPRIQMELPHLVIVSARPIKPSCSDCRDAVTPNK